MEVINYLSLAIIPAIIIIIVCYSFMEKNNVFEIFIDGAREGAQIVCNIFPTLVGLFVAVGALRNSGFLELIINIISPVIGLCGFPIEVLPLAILRPISGSAATAIATDIMINFGVDSDIGKIASIIMGSTETTLYTIAVYTSCVKIKKTRGIIIAALVGDIVGMIMSVIMCNFLRTIN